MRKLLVLALALTLLSTAACSLGLGIAAIQPLNDEQLARYIQAYSNVRALIPELGPPSDNMKALQDLNAINLQSIDAAVNKAGLKGHEEFVLLSAKVGAALGVLEAKELSQGMGKDVSKKISAGRAGLEKALRSPNLPAEARAKLQAQLEATQSTVEDGKAWASKLLALVETFSSDASQDTVRRHRDELRAAFR